MKGERERKREKLRLVWSWQTGTGLVFSQILLLGAGLAPTAASWQLEGPH